MKIRVALRSRTLQIFKTIGNLSFLGDSRFLSGLLKRLDILRSLTLSMCSSCDVGVLASLGSPSALPSSILPPADSTFFGRPLFPFGLGQVPFEWLLTSESSCNTLHCATLHSITAQLHLQLQMQLHLQIQLQLQMQLQLNYTYITTTLHLHFNYGYTTLHYATLRYTTLHYATLRYTTLHYATLRYTTLHYTTLRYTTLHYATLRYTTLHYATLRYTTLHYATLRYTTLHYATLTTTATTTTPATATLSTI